MTVRHRGFGEGRVEEIEDYIKKSVKWCLERIDRDRVRFLMDVGCNYGYAIRVFGRDGWDGVGIDINPQNLLPDVRVYEIPMEKLIENFPLEVEWPTLYFFNHSLEHSVRAWEVVESVFGYLPLGGAIFIAVPDVGSKDYISGSHRAIYTREFLYHMLGSIGFEDVVVERVCHRVDHPELYCVGIKRKV